LLLVAVVYASGAAVTLARVGSLPLAAHAEGIAAMLFVAANSQESGPAPAFGSENAGAVVDIPVLGSAVQ